jgi:protein phosphatase PTC7
VKEPSAYATSNGGHQEKSAKSSKQRERLERGMSSMKRNHSIQGVYLAGEEASLGCHESNVPMFSEDVYADIYDHELILRLDPAVLQRFDWESAPVGGPCLGTARLWAGSARIGKKLGECEDSCFVSHCALGVADGVGGMANYADHGMNSAAFAADLMQLARDACLTGEEQCASFPSIPPEERALNAVRVANEKARSFGASTIAVAVVSQGTIGVANLGDSGFMILRRGRHRRLEIVSRSREQHHRWNCPYQLTRLPQSLTEKFPGFSCDLPDDCQRYSARLHSGDLVLMFSDGLKDNLHDYEILHIAERSLTPMVSQLLGMPKYTTAPEALAQALVQAAHERSCDPKARVPFGAYCREHGLSHEGGKMDDITVVVAWVLDQGSQAQASL